MQINAFLLISAFFTLVHWDAVVYDSFFSFLFCYVRSWRLLVIGWKFVELLRLSLKKKSRIIPGKFYLIQKFTDFSFHFVTESSNWLYWCNRNKLPINFLKILIITSLVFEDIWQYKLYIIKLFWIIVF